MRKSWKERRGAEKWRGRHPGMKQWGSGALSNIRQSARRSWSYRSRRQQRDSLVISLDRKSIVWLRDRYFCCGSAVTHVNAALFHLSKQRLKLALAFLTGGLGKKTDIAMFSRVLSRCGAWSPWQLLDSSELPRFAVSCVPSACAIPHTSGPGVALPRSPRVTPARPRNDNRSLQGRIKHSEDAWLVSRLPSSAKVKARERPAQPTMKKKTYLSCLGN